MPLIFQSDRLLGNDFDEEDSLIPLASDLKTGRFFVLMQARQLLEKYPEYINEIISMSFIEIWNDGLRETYPDIFDNSSRICTIQSDGTLLDGSGLEYFQLVETQVL